MWQRLITSDYVSDRINLSKQFFRFSCKVQGKIRNISILSITAFGETKRVFGMMIGNVFFERGGRFVFAAFCFNGYDLSAILQHKVDLTIFVGEAAGLNRELSAKLL